jgi:hypothetical protein
VDRSASLKNSVQATIEDGHNILPQRPRKCPLTFVWPTLHDKVLVSLKISHAVSLDLISISQALGVFLSGHNVLSKWEWPCEHF